MRRSGVRARHFAPIVILRVAKSLPNAVQSTLAECARFAGALRRRSPRWRVCECSAEHAPRMRALRWRIAALGSTLVSRRRREQGNDLNRSLHLHPIPGHIDSNQPISAEGGPLWASEGPRPSAARRGCAPLGVQQTKHARRALRPEPGREENPPIQTPRPKAKSTPSNGGPARSDARRSVPQRSGSSSASWPARKAIAKAAQRLKTHF